MNPLLNPTTEQLDRLAVLLERARQNVEANRTIGKPRSSDGRKRKKAIHNRTPAQIEADFWHRVIIGTPTECWQWSSAKYGNAGHLYGGFAANGKIIKCHVYMATLFYGESLGFIVCHHCDNTECCNPLHLYYGTPKTNAQDRKARNRMAVRRGEDAANSKLNAAQVLEIRQRSNENQHTMAKEFGVCVQTINNIIHKSRWAHI